MTQRELDLNKERAKAVKKLNQLLPELTDKILDVSFQVCQDGALSGKVKRLMCLAVALGAGCRNCILGQTMLALEQGATNEEILETLSVVISMRGTTGLAESCRVVQLLEELGRL